MPMRTTVPSMVNSCSLLTCLIYLKTYKKNIAICVEYFKRLGKINIWLKMAIRTTGGEEDSVNKKIWIL